ncbi:hypothetical protein FRC10_011754 [Ceratobasidium sp. 414]|nr:hypothetical protein FRC10_011754 [Ceratobasidium sp. 414]
MDPDGDGNNDSNKQPCPCCQKPLGVHQIQRHLTLNRRRLALQLRLDHTRGAGEGGGGGGGGGNGEVEGDANPMVDNAGKHIDAVEGTSDNEHIRAGGGMDAGNLGAEEPAQPVIEMTPNDANVAVHDAGRDIPLNPAHGLRRNPPVMIENWPDPEPDAEPLEGEGELDDNEPVDGPDRDPEYIEHDMPAGLNPIDEPRLADEEIRQILQRNLGDLAAQQWVDMYDCILSKRDRNMLRMLAVRLRTHFSRDTWDDLRQGVCEDLNIPSEFIAWRCLRLLAELETSAYDCKLQDLDRCPYCREARYNSRSNARRLYCYTPLIPQLCGLFQNKNMARKLGYRVEAKQRFDPNVIEDVFDGANYRTLRQTPLHPDSGYHFFDNPQDIALGIRNRIENVICVGVIPSPKQCKDLNSFLIPLLDELLALERGVEVGGFVPGEDTTRNFPLRAFLILGFGDIPAVTKMLLFKAHNAMTPCRACIMQGVLCQLSERKFVYYIPLTNPRTRETFPIDELPMRSHAQTLTVFAKID